MTDTKTNAQIEGDDILVLDNEVQAVNVTECLLAVDSLLLALREIAVLSDNAPDGTNLDDVNRIATKALEGIYD